MAHLTVSCCVFISVHLLLCINGSRFLRPPPPSQGLQPTCMAPIKLTPTDSIIAILKEVQTVSDGFLCITFGPQRMGVLDAQKRELPSVFSRGLHVCVVPAQSKQNRNTSW